MNVKLYTEGLKYFVAEHIIPPFTVAPGVIHWGDRTFIRVTHPGIEQYESEVYTEAFAYTIVPDWMVK